MVAVNFQIKELLQPDVRSPFGAWFVALDVAAAKVSVAVARIEQRKQNESKGK